MGQPSLVYSSQLECDILLLRYELEERLRSVYSDAKNILWSIGATNLVAIVSSTMRDMMRVRISIFLYFLWTWCICLCF